MADYLLETALLAHGLPSIPDETIFDLWTAPHAKLVWLEQGEIIIGTIEQYLLLRKDAAKLKRIDGAALAAAAEQKMTGCLTASATMQVCAKRGIPVAVTCGMGGIGPYPLQHIGADLSALSELPVSLVATAPKDVFDLRATLQWLKQQAVKIIGNQLNYCDGFLVHQEKIILDGIIGQTELSPPLLILNGFGEKIAQKSQLSAAMAFGRQVQVQGGLYHPAVNNKLDELTAGASSNLQLLGLIDNAKLADSLAIS